MKKAVSMFLAAALAVGTFAGCGSSADTGSTGSAASTESGSTDSAADGSVFKIGPCAPCAPAPRLILALTHRASSDGESGHLRRKRQNASLCRYLR